MGHDIHFLTRLERLSDEEHLELAKSLYRDTSLLKHVLGRARLPEGAARAAISLGSESGPYLIVTRDGHFVTCLGEGMSTGDLPVIARAHLDALALENAVLRERLQLVRKMAGGREESRLINMLFRGRYLSREQFLALSALQPTFARSLPWLLAEIEEMFIGVRAAVIAATCKPPERLTHAQREVLTKTSAAMWAAGHIALLLASGRRDALEQAMTVGEPSEQLRDSRRLFVPATRFPEVGILMRAGLAIAKVGKPCLPAAKRRYLNRNELFHGFEGTLALLALGARHRALRAEIYKSCYEKFATEKPDGAPGSFLGFFGEKGEEFLIDAGRANYQARTAHLSPSSPFRFRCKEDVPEDLAIGALATSPLPIGMDLVKPDVLLSAIPGAARRKPEELYLPGKLVEALPNPNEYKPEALDAWFCLRTIYARAKVEPVHIAPKPAGNAPCTCGSGKKFKRCCGLAA
ncbi:MAG: YecA family protein [Myxococcales bacterium]|jgi:hypothetical protein